MLNMLSERERESVREVIQKKKGTEENNRQDKQHILTPNQ